MVDAMGGIEHGVDMDDAGDFAWPPMDDALSQWTFTPGVDRDDADDAGEAGYAADDEDESELLEQLREEISKHR